MPDRTVLEAWANGKRDLFNKSDAIDPVLFQDYGVYMGLRDEKGKGVLTGLTNISEMNAFREVDGQRVPIDGELWYRGYLIQDLIRSLGPKKLGYERIAYLLLLGQMPDEQQEEEFFRLIGENRPLPENFVRDVIMKAPTADIMNAMTKSILTLASHDPDVLHVYPEGSLRRGVQLISWFPSLAVYAYHSYNYKRNDATMYIHNPDPSLSTAENLLMMLRPDQSYTDLEAKVLDTALILHMEHGGGNNSTFVTRVVTSTGSDAYSTIASAMSSLKGPKHGGANIKVMQMMEDIRNHVKNWRDEEEVAAYLKKMLAGEAYDGKGLIYGIGHAVYTLSDPRERVFKSFVERLAAAKGRDDDMALYQSVENTAPGLLAARSPGKYFCPNVDFYSGFVYDMLGIPQELYTALFAVARIVGWSAHRLEELITSDKIIRPAYMSVMKNHYPEVPSL